MDGSRFDWEVRQDQGGKGNRARLDELPVAKASDIEAGVADRPGAPMAAWAPVLIWITLGLTLAISASL
ncbi:MAG: hypothetical protein MRY74_12495 [Neomegalonema sp.]|nr:hypothetical protein [Neomegalonema sp.]